MNSGLARFVVVDTLAIERKKDMVTHWARYSIRPGAPEVMAKNHMRADCREGTIGYLSAVRYNAPGRQIGTSPFHPGPIQSIPPDSLGDEELQSACGTDSYCVANEQFSLAIDEVSFAEAPIADSKNPVTAHTVNFAVARKLAPLAPDVTTPVIATPAVLKSEDETSLHDDETEVQILAKSCNEDDADACRQLGTLFADGAEVAKDASRAALLFAKACAGDDADACTLIGIAYHNGAGVERNEERAAAFFGEACEKGGPAACGNIGLAYVQGNGVERDVKRAFGYFTLACDSGNASGCSSLGAAYTMGLAVKPSPRRARALFKKACDGDDSTGCYNLGVVYDQGLGVRKDRARAVPLYIRACDAREGAACGNLGILVQNGWGIGKDAVKAAELFDKACEGADADGCLNLGLAYQAGSGVQRDTVRAADYYRRALAIEPDKATARRALVSLTSG